MASSPGPVVGVDVIDHDLLADVDLDGAVDAEDRRAALVPEHDPGPQVALPDADRAGLERDLQPGDRRADRRLGGGELQLGDDARRQLLEQCGLVVGPGPRLGVVDGQDADHVPGRRDQRHAEVGLDLARRDRRQVRDPLVLGRASGTTSGGAAADDDRRQRPGQQGRAADHARRQAVPADDGVLVGEQRDLGVAGAEQPRGQAGEPVERGVAVHLDEQPAGGRDPVRIVQDVGLRRVRDDLWMAHGFPFRRSSCSSTLPPPPFMLSCGRLRQPCVGRLRCRTSVIAAAAPKGARARPQG